MEPKQLREFTIFWKDGIRELVTGRTAEEGISLKGYAEKALLLVDFYLEGDCADKSIEEQEKLYLEPRMIAEEKIFFTR